MQKSGVAKDEAHSQAPQIESELRRAGLKTRIADIIRKRKTREAPDISTLKEEEINPHIDRLFIFSESAQPSRGLNTGAGIADSASLFLMRFNHPAAVLGLVGAVASEGISLLKNYTDTRHYSELRRSEREYLKEYESKLLSALKYKLSHTKNDEQRNKIKELMRETDKLFSEIEKKSKEGLATALGSRLEGFIGSGAALILTYIPPLKMLVDWTSDYITNFMRAQPVQINPDAALIDIGVRVGYLAFVSILTTSAVSAAYELHRESNKSLASRKEERMRLDDRMEELLKRIQQVCK
jgi:hypothetical protein